MHRCSACHSTEVEEMVWIDMNTGERMEGETGEHYCRKCETHTEVYETSPIEEYEEGLDFDTDAEQHRAVGPAEKDRQSDKPTPN